MDPALLETLKQPIWQYYIAVLLSIVPVVRIFRRAGQNPLAALAIFVPWLGIILMPAILAFRPWPKMHPLPKKEKKKGAGT